MSKHALWILTVAAVLANPVSAVAGPWTAIGDAPLRSDIELLESAGVLDSIGTHWPLPWAGILQRIEDPSATSGQPDYILAAVQRVKNRGRAETTPDDLKLGMVVDLASSPAVVRGYDALGRQPMMTQAILDYSRNGTYLHLAAGARSTTTGDRQTLALDGSYLAQRIGNTVVYGGYLSHWWGSGWMSALSLSNNARPIPQIGISRASTAPFESSWLRWIGSWQFEFFVGVLDGPRIAHNTIFDGTRITVSPLPGLEIGAARLDMMCGSGHPCKPLAGYFDVANDSHHNNTVNGQSNYDIRYTGAIQALNYALYLQLMSEDTNFWHYSGTSHLYGASLWSPVSDGVLRITAEYADTTASNNLFGGFAMHGFSYNNGEYRDGMRYRGSTLGFSLDSDSRLMSLQAAFTDHAARTFTLTYHRAKLSDPLNTWFNVVTTAPVKINVLEARASLPLGYVTRAAYLDITTRYESDQPRPKRGGLGSVEAALRFDL